MSGGDAGLPARRGDRSAGRLLWLKSAVLVVGSAIAWGGTGGPVWAQGAAQGVGGEKAPAQWAGVGDSSDVAVPLAKDLSLKLTQKSIDKAMRKVGDWELARARTYFSRDWTFAATYTGYLAAADALPDRRYRDAMIDVGKKYEWRLGPRVTHADGQAIGQTYLGLYLEMHRPEMLLPTKTQFDGLLKLQGDPEKPVWWWCDALFMAPYVWAKLYKATGDHAYLDYMDREWWITSKLLYDPAEQLYFRDATFLSKREKNGAKLFWSRGNGWVLAGLARVLEDMPEDYPSRPKYVAQFQAMANRIALLQGPDGLWRPGLLDAGDYALPENSGSAFFVYGMAWGIHHGLLDGKKYLSVVERGWAGLLQHVYEDGRLGCIQPVGAAPGDFKETSSYAYGIGAFLLAGSELKSLGQH